jgi:hypothetical protein
MNKRFLKNAVITFTFIIAVTNFSFYVAETVSGKPVFANTLKVLGFCPAPAIETQRATTIAPPAISGPAGAKGDAGATGNTGKTGTTGATGPAGATGSTGAKGDTGATGATGAQGEPGINGASGGGGAASCQAPINLISLPGDLIPAIDNLYSLGDATHRWKGLQLGPGTLYIQDVTTGLQAGLTVDGGTLLLDGTDSLRIGNIRLTKKGIESVISDQDITIGNLTDRGYALFAHGIKFPDGTIQTTALLQGIKGDTGVTGATGAQGIKGDTGLTGPQGLTGPAGTAGANGSSGGSGSQGIQGIQGIQGLPGTPGTIAAYWGSFYSEQTQANPVINTVNAMTFNGTPDANGVTIVDSSKIRVTNAGVYNLQFSAQIDKADSGTDGIDIWLAKNGNNVAWSNTRLWLIGNDAKQVAAWNFVITLAAGDYVQIYWSSADKDVRIYAEPASTGPIRPAIPSVIATLTQVAS